jgi:hypothetical protein
VLLLLLLLLVTSLTMPSTNSGTKDGSIESSVGGAR